MFLFLITEKGKNHVHSRSVMILKIKINIDEFQQSHPQMAERKNG